MDALYNFINDKNTNFLGKNTSSLWGFFGVKHPTQKSLALMEKIISIHTNPNDIVLDPFMGISVQAFRTKFYRHRIRKRIFSNRQKAFEFALKTLFE
ncbi:DNA (Cytosine-5-)-methyltransferase [Helicobacter pylori CPY6311]|nr:DNA (Cytosine-5-)-methyltransferase [Helicobacter pylori CPY6311]